MTQLTQERLKELLDYDPETGEFRWRKSVGRAAAGDVAGSDDANGYRRIRIQGTLYLSHRLAWLYEYGHTPETDLDHINGIRNSNQIKNLRIAPSRAEQQQNQPLHRNNSSGFPGVSLNELAGRWGARIQVDNKTHYLGLFDTAEEAGLAYRDAKRKLHTFHPVVRDFDYGQGM